MGRLKGRTALVTGAAQGIGAHYAHALAQEGASVAVCDVVSSDEVVARIRNAGGTARSFVTDVGDEAAVAVTVRSIADEFGKIDILVNNAAIFASLKFQPFDAISSAEWDAVMRVNVTGLFNCCRAVVPAMKEAGKGKIVNISSGTVFLGSQMLLHYVTSKAAVLGFTRALARELGPSGICVNAIAPGLTESEGVVANAAYGAVVRERVHSSRAIPRAQAPVDLIGALLFFASEESDFVTGQTLVVDGGHVMH